MNLARNHRASEAALAWCLEKQLSDGSIRMEQNCLDGLYKFPAAFEVMGRYVEASKLLGWLERAALRESGDLGFPERKVLFPWHRDFSLYTNSWIVIGAQRAGCFRLAQRAMEFILRFQNPDTGDFLSRADGVASDGRHDTTITANCGLAALFLGRLEEAKRAAAGLENVVQQQVADDPVFYFRTDRQGRIIRNFRTADAPVHGIDSRKPGQLYWYLGIASALLCQVHLVTGDPKCLEAAGRIFDFLRRCQPDVLASFASGKVGYAAALLYRITGRAEYREAANQLVDWLLSVQKPDGRWVPDDPKLEWFLAYDCTAEFVYWMAEITRIVAVADDGWSQTTTPGIRT